ncbi:MAG TPA: hypothetical protein VM370_07390 [Candidatus Thermoplasmatota archaeon]|nr:hypothetical protein [Candidatus Thermoplasmatota archaeon]
MRFDIPERFELVPEEKVRRGTATINVSWADKEVFDAIQWWLTYRMGREATQWDVFSFLLGEALGNRESPLRNATLFPS